MKVPAKVPASVVVPDNVVAPVELSATDTPSVCAVALPVKAGLIKSALVAMAV